MKKIATAFALTALSMLLYHDQSQAQQQKPAAEYSATWDAMLNKWKDTVQTFTISYAPEYTLTSRNAKYQTTYSGFVPSEGDVYQSRFFWEPMMTYSTVRIDSIRGEGSLMPVRLDEYDRSVKGRVGYVRSIWEGNEWKPFITSTSMTDSMGIVRSIVNYATMNGKLVLTDSTHVDVTQDIKGNVTNVKVSQWTMEEPTLQVIAEQRYTLNGDGSIGVAEFWDNTNGDLAPALRMHDFDWAVRNKDFTYVQREQGSQLFYGGDGYRSAMVDLPSGTDWTEFYQVQQNFDDVGRVNSYTFNGMTRDTFAFDGGLLTLSQRDELKSGQWSTGQGSRTIYERDANGALRSVITQRFDPNTSKYINDREYFYSLGAADVASDIPQSNVSLFPNPAEEEITISADASILSVEVVSSTGVVLVQSNSSRIDVSKLTPGAYNVRITTAKGTEIRKFVKPY